MNPLEAPFQLRISDGDRSIALRGCDHVRMYSTVKNTHFGELLSERQTDLLRIATAVHIADGWVRRRRPTNKIRNLVLDVEVLDADFWSRPETRDRLKRCVDFVSGGDDWCFRFQRSSASRREWRKDLFRGIDPLPIVLLYSGGLDSAAGLALRLAAMPERTFIPVTVRHQFQRERLIRDHFRMLIKSDLVTRSDLKPFQVGVFIKNKRIKREFQTRLREVTHRCRPMPFMSVAGLVADSVGSGEVEVYESGVGSINLPLVDGPANYRTTRSTHPYFLRLMSDLISHVSGNRVEFFLPFSDHTKGEMVRRVKELGLEDLARCSVSCTLHPIRRGGRQCGYCPACVYRRQAMLVAGIEEERDAYVVDLFSPWESFQDVPERHLEAIRAFEQQVGRLAELDADHVPGFFRRHLTVTRAVSTDAEISPYIEVYRRYRREWEAIITEARRRGAPWTLPGRSPAMVGGAAP